MSTHVHRCWAEIDGAALLHNIAVTRDHLPAGAQLMAIVKANAYGHGLEAVLETLGAHVEWLGVANLEEGLEIQTILPQAKILVLGTALPSERVEIVLNQLQPAISTLEEARAYAKLGTTERPVSVQLTIDTGMGRMGFLEGEIAAAMPEIARLTSLHVSAIYTHLPVPDEDECFTAAQLSRYETLVGRLRKWLPGRVISHSLNSAGIIILPAHGATLVRAGLMLYGSSPIPAFQTKLRAVMTLKSRIILIRELPTGHGVSYGRTYITTRPTRVATVAAGYADGYQRRLSNRETSVLIHGQRCPLLGRVTMDQIMVDVTNVPNAVVEDEVILFGRSGEAEILAAEVAEKAETIPWEIFTGISKRVPRIPISD